MRATSLGALAVALGLGLGLASLALGAVRVPLGDVLRALAGAEVDPLASGVVLGLRLPRALVAAQVGAALGVAGALVQGLFRNPLVDPGLLGVQSGASLAAAAAMVAGWPGAWLPGAAFAGALAATSGTAFLARGAEGTSVAWLILAGVAVNALCGAGTGLVLFTADDAALRSYTFWALGSVAGADRAAVGVLLVLGVGPMGLARAFATPLDALALGEAEAGHLGVRVERLKAAIVALVALSVGSTVAVCGAVGFVGLVAPHAVRLAVGPAHRLVLPGSALVGANLVLAADLVARTAVAPAELPLGVVTGLIGAPSLLILLHRARGTS